MDSHCNYLIHAGRHHHKVWHSNVSNQICVCVCVHEMYEVENEKPKCD